VNFDGTSPGIGAAEKFPPVPSHRILVVEDDPSLRQLNTEALARSGYHVDQAVDGAAGWEALQARQYDLVVTDHSMPKVTGLQLVQLLRAHGVTLPVIMTSGTLPMEELERHPGVINAFLPKPYGLGQLLDAVQALLGGPANGLNHRTDAVPSLFPSPPGR
jgi:DNA-binding response OmpR family regulator